MVASHKHTKRIFEVAMMGKGFIVVVFLLAGFNAIWKFSQELGRRRLAREDALRGFSIPISAVRKGARQMGKQIDGMDEGWIDMEAFDENSDNSSGSGNNNKNDKKRKDGKNKKNPSDDDDNNEED